MKTTPTTHRAKEYLRVKIIEKQSGNELDTIEVSYKDNLSDAITNIALNMGFKRHQITYTIL